MSPCAPVFLCECLFPGGVGSRGLRLSVVSLFPGVCAVDLSVRVCLSPSLFLRVFLPISPGVRVSVPPPLSLSFSLSPSMKYRSVWLIRPHYFSEHLPLKFEQMGQGLGQRLGLPRPHSPPEAPPEGAARAAAHSPFVQPPALPS